MNALAELPAVTAVGVVFDAARRAAQPRQPITVSEWADANRVLSPEASAEPGQWKTDRVPYLREIMDCLSEDSPVRKVAFQKASQTGGTECGSNWLGYVMAHAKGPIAIVMPTEKSLNDWMSQKFDPMARDTHAVAAVLAARTNRAGDNSAQRKRFVGGILYAKTAGSTAELKSTSLRYAIADEVDEYDWTTLQGDPLGLLEVRLTTYHDRKLFVPSSPTLRDASRIEELFLGGDRRRYCVPCPHCRERQHLKWSNLRWDKQGRRVTAAWYVCEHCGALIEEHHKAALLANGRWVPEAPEAAWRSYHINALYAPIGLGLSWPELAEEWLEAQDDNAKLMRFINTRLGETWADHSHEVKSNALAARAEPYALRTIPPGCLVLTAGVDVQDDRLEIQVLGHGRTDRRWTIDYHVLPGNPVDDGLWERLAEYLSAGFFNAWGKTMHIEAAGIDTGGHHTHAVYAFVRSNRVRRALALKGASSQGRVILGKPSRQDVNWKGQTIKHGIALYMVGADTAKHWLYNAIHADADKDPSDRKLHFSSALDLAFFDGLVSEVFNPRRNRWELRKGKRNEPLDTWIYALAASHHPELYLHKWRAADWLLRQQMLEPETLSQAEQQLAAAAAPQPRRIVSRGRFA